MQMSCHFPFGKTRVICAVLCVTAVLGTQDHRDLSVACVRFWLLQDRNLKVQIRSGMLE